MLHMWYPEATSRPVCPACTCSQLSRRSRVRLETGHFSYSVRRPFPPQLELLRVCRLYPPNNSPNQLVHLDHLWKPSAQLARSSDWPFQSSNVPKNYGTRSNWYVRSPPNPLRTIRALMIILYSISMFAGRIGESGALGSAHRIRKGYQPPRVTLQ